MTYVTPRGFGSSAGSGSVASAEAISVLTSPVGWGVSSVTPGAVMANLVIGGVVANKGVSRIVEGADKRVSVVVGCIVGIDAGKACHEWICG